MTASRILPKLAAAARSYQKPRLQCVHVRTERNLLAKFDANTYCSLHVHDDQARVDDNRSIACCQF